VDGVADDPAQEAGQEHIAEGSRARCAQASHKHHRRVRLVDEVVRNDVQQHRHH
jgi:hypothetical protein